MIHHIDDDTLERYVVCGVSPDELITIDLHLHFCRSCQRRLAETIEFMRSLREAMVTPSRSLPMLLRVRLVEIENERNRIS